MKPRIVNQYSLVAPLMIIIAIIGFSFSTQRKKIFYLPIGSIGLYLIISKDFNRRKVRGMILKKVQSYNKDK
tara:strand:+ start:273 stop:488 length:216 start_codon:yes stop_codon:yes gene_type:complete